MSEKLSMPEVKYFIEIQYNSDLKTKFEYVLLNDFK